MKKIIFAQVLTSNGKADFSGLYDNKGNAVTVEMERDKNGVSLIAWKNEANSKQRDCGISEEEIQRTCSMHENCDNCPLNDYCREDIVDE